MNKRNKLSKKLKADFRDFLENHPPLKFNSRLRSIFLDYLRYETKAGTSPLYLHDFLWSINDLFDLLDTAAKEFNQHSHSSHPSPPVERACPGLDPGGRG